MSSNCIFCKIISKDAPGEILYEDDTISVFKDIKPAAKFHLLACPKNHIDNVNGLTGDHKELLEQLAAIGRRIIEEKGGDVNDILMGFHMPPFNSVSHLHLHVISPSSDMSLINRIIFKPNPFWFSSVDTILEKVGNSKL